MTTQALAEVGAHDALATARGRFTFIDALRGLAAISVVLCHSFAMSAIGAPLREHVPTWLAYAIETYTPRGVQVFFVISGFVIAHSLRATPMTLGGCGRFILRRQLRLDPPYWTMILLGVVTFYAGGKVMHVASPLPPPKTLIGNMLYLQGICRLPDLIVVGWTLAIEIQFYFAFLLILALGRRATASPLAIGLLTVTALAALVTNPNVVWEGRWAGHAWPFFVGGVLCYWAYVRQAPAWPMAVVLAGLLASCVRFGVQSQVVVGVSTVLIIYAVGRSGLLQTALDNGPVQFLGRISYSLYLSHMLIVLTLQQATKHSIHTVAGAVGLFVTDIGLSLVFACVLHRLIELPSMRLATRFKQDRGPSAATGFGEELPPVEDRTTRGPNVPALG